MNVNVVAGAHLDVHARNAFVVRTTAPDYRGGGYAVPRNAAPIDQRDSGRVPGNGVAAAGGSRSAYDVRPRGSVGSAASAPRAGAADDAAAVFRSRRPSSAGSVGPGYPGPGPDAPGIGRRRGAHRDAAFLPDTFRRHHRRAGLPRRSASQPGDRAGRLRRREAAGGAWVQAGALGVAGGTCPYLNVGIYSVPEQSSSPARAGEGYRASPDAGRVSPYQPPNAGYRAVPGSRPTRDCRRPTARTGAVTLIPGVIEHPRHADALAPDGDAARTRTGSAPICQRPARRERRRRRRAQPSIAVGRGQRWRQCRRRRWRHRVGEAAREGIIGLGTGPPEPGAPSPEPSPNPESRIRYAHSYYGSIRRPLRPPRRHRRALRARGGARHRSPACSSPTPATCRRSRRSTTTRRAPSRASTARDGEVVGEFATQRRVVIPYDDIPPLLRQAIIAAEDAEFEQHFGLSIPRIVVAAASRDIDRAAQAPAAPARSRSSSRASCSSSRRRRRWERKIKEALLAIQIEKRYTKHEIFTLYCNQMYLGPRRLRRRGGVAALLRQVGQGSDARGGGADRRHHPGAERQSPYVNMERATRRRNYALQRMADEGFITRGRGRRRQGEADRRRAASRRGAESIAPYFVEEVRKHLESDYGAKALYENGLAVQTTLDLELQDAANRALDDGLRALDKRRGFRKPRAQRRRRGPHDRRRSGTPRWNRPMAAGDIVPAVVDRPSTAPRSSCAPARCAVDASTARASRGRGKTSPAELVTRGDLVEVRLVDGRRGRRHRDGARSSRRRSSKARCSRSTTAPARSWRWSAASASSAASSTARRRRTGSSARRSSRSSTRPRSIAATRRPRSSMDAPVDASRPAPGQPPYAPQNYDQQVRGPDHAAARARAVAQRARGAS